jgi:hypothetical protein
MSATPLDAKVSAVLDQKTAGNDLDDVDEDELFDALEREDDSAYRAHRIQQLHSELVSAKDALHRNVPAGTLNTTETLYPTLSSDEAVLDLTTNNERCVVHFSHPDFARCAVMDEHLRTLARRHFEVRFSRVNVRDCPFIVEKLNVRVLPCVIGFVDGLGKERIVGFEGLGGGSSRQDGVDDFQTGQLERRLLQSGVLVREKIGDQGEDRQYDDNSDSEDDGQTRRRGIRDGNAGRNRHGQNKDDDDDEDDWD